MSPVSVFTLRRVSVPVARLLPFVAVLSFLARPAAAEVISADAAGVDGTRQLVAKTGGVGSSLTAGNHHANECVGDSVRPVSAIASASCSIGGPSSLLAVEAASAAFRQSLAGDLRGNSWTETCAGLGNAPAAVAVLDAASPADVWEAFTHSPASVGTMSDSATLSTPLAPVAVPSTMVLAGVGPLTSLE